MHLRYAKLHLCKYALTFRHCSWSWSWNVNRRIIWTWNCNQFSGRNGLGQPNGSYQRGLWNALAWMGLVSQMTLAREVQHLWVNLHHISLDDAPILHVHSYVWCIGTVMLWACVRLCLTHVCSYALCMCTDASMHMYSYAYACVLLLHACCYASVHVRGYALAGL